MTTRHRDAQSEILAARSSKRPRPSKELSQTVNVTISKIDEKRKIDKFLNIMINTFTRMT